MWKECKIVGQTCSEDNEHREHRKFCFGYQLIIFIREEFIEKPVKSYFAFLVLLDLFKLSYSTNWNFLHGVVRFSFESWSAWFNIQASRVVVSNFS